MLTQPSSAPWIEQSKQAPYFLKTAFIAMGVLSLWNPKAHGGSLDEGFFTPERLAEIFPRVSLSTVSEEIKKDLHTKITTDTEFHSLHHIRDYLLAELRSKWIFPMWIEVQIVPFFKNENGEYEYLKISITSMHGTTEHQEDLFLTTSDTDGTSVILGNMIYAFEEHISQCALVVFQQEMDGHNWFERARIQKKIDTVVQLEFDTHMRNCIHYKWAKIVRDANGNAEIHLFIYDIPTETMGYFPVETGTPIPEPRKHNDGPMMMAQNTSGIEE